MTVGNRDTRAAPRIFAGVPTHAVIWLPELVPRQRLMPHTRYLLRVTWTLDNGTYHDEMTFVTGDGPLRTAPPEPRAWIELWKPDDGVSGNSCEYSGSGACIAIPDGHALIEYRTLSPFDGGRHVSEAQLLRRSAGMEVGGLGDPESFCMLLRTRALNGSYSAERRVCGSSEVTLGSMSDLTCTSAGVQSPHIVGCSVVLSPKRNLGSVEGVASICFALALLFRRTRRAGATREPVPTFCA